MNEKIYPSDLTDEEWEWIKEVIPAAQSGGRPRTLCMRAVLNAIFYVTKGGIPWRMLPVNFPKWQSVYHDLRAWKLPGVWVGQRCRTPRAARPAGCGGGRGAWGRVPRGCVCPPHTALAAVRAGDVALPVSLGYPRPGGSTGRGGLVVRRRRRL